MCDKHIILLYTYLLALLEDDDEDEVPVLELCFGPELTKDEWDEGDEVRPARE